MLANCVGGIIHPSEKVLDIKIPSCQISAFNQSCAPTYWWSAAALGGLMPGGGGVGGVIPDEGALKQHTCWTGVSSGITEVSHFTCDLRWTAGAKELTVNMHVVHNFTVVMS